MVTNYSDHLSPVNSDVLAQFVTSLAQFVTSLAQFVTYNFFKPYKYGVSAP
jgi:hypothetical protein